MKESIATNAVSQASNQLKKTEWQKSVATKRKASTGTLNQRVSSVFFLKKNLYQSSISRPYFMLR